MSNHSGSEQRCSEVFWDWATKDHQCLRPSQQARGSIAACYVHAREKFR